MISASSCKSVGVCVTIVTSLLSLNKGKIMYETVTKPNVK